MDRPLNIVIIGTAHPLRGGLAAFNERLAEEFLRMGHRVALYTFRLQYPSFLFPGKSQFSAEPPPAHLDIRIRINSINPLNWWKTGSEIGKLKPDIAVVKFWLPFMGPCFGTIVGRVRKNNHTRVISILDNVLPHEPRPGDRAFIRYFIKSCDAFIAMSRKVLEDLGTFTTQKPALLIPHPLYDNFGEKISKQEARSRLQLPVDEKIILFFGFIRKYKGLEMLLQAMSDPRIRTAGIRLIVAGEFYEDEAPYRELIEKLQIGDALILKTDFIPDSEVKYYFCAADAVIQPYHSATQSGISPMAYHFEKPMVVTNVGGLPEIVPDGKAGYVVAPNPEAIADGILRFYEAGEDHFVENIRIEKKKYAWSNMVEGVIQLAVSS